MLMFLDHCKLSSEEDFGESVEARANSKLVVVHHGPTNRSPHSLKLLRPDLLSCALRPRDVRLRWYYACYANVAEDSVSLRAKCAAGRKRSMSLQFQEERAMMIGAASMFVQCSSRTYGRIASLPRHENSFLILRRAFSFSKMTS